MCTQNGTIFDITNILPWIKERGTNPVDGTPLKSADLVRLNVAKNESGEYVDPVTYKVLTDNTHIVALRNTWNVFAWDTVERLNIKGKLWRDLVSDEEFGRKDIITLQDPQNLESRNLNNFGYMKSGETGLPEDKLQAQNDPANNVNVNALGSSAKIIKAKEAVAKARADRAQGGAAAATKGLTKTGGASMTPLQKTASQATGKSVPYNAARHTTGLAAASLTSTGMTPHTSGELALLSDEEYMLKRGRIKHKGYARISTTTGDLNLELHTEFAPQGRVEFHQAGQERLLPGCGVPSQHQRLHDPRRRSHGVWPGRRERLGEVFQRRVRGAIEARLTGDVEHGQQGQEHEQQSIVGLNQSMLH